MYVVETATGYYQLTRMEFIEGRRVSGWNYRASSETEATLLCKAHAHSIADGIDAKVVKIRVNAQCALCEADARWQALNE